MREIFDFDHLTLSSVRTMNGSSAEIGIIYQCVSPTLSKFSVQLNNNESYWKAAAFLARGLVDLYHDHHREIDVNLKAVNGPARQLTNRTMLQLFAKLSARAAARVVEKVSQFEQWVLAYRIAQNPFKYLLPPIDHFWADPFPIQFEGRYYIFFEDFGNDIGKACISVIEVDEERIINGPTEVLKLDCHLSYPFVFEWQGEYYMIPETGDKNVVELYRSSSFPYSWERTKTLLEAKCPLDATLVEVSDTWWMFVNIQQENVAINWDELHIYYAESPLGPWKPHALNPVMSDVRSARPAGRLFTSNHVLYRPSQDSSQGYGYAMTVNRITRLTPTEYSEVPVGKILPDWDREIRGVHTLNVMGDITVIDCLTKRNRLTRRDLHPPDLGIIETLLRGSTA
jgi:hypothetical protein